MRVVSVIDIGRLVRTRRKDMGWSQQRLAEVAGVSRSWIVELEAGKTRSEIDLVLRTVDALGLVLDISDQQATQGRVVTASDHIDLDEVLRQHIDVVADRSP